MNFEQNFVPEITTTEPIKASVKTTTLTDTVLVMPDGEIINEKYETTTVENLILVPKTEPTNQEMEWTNFLPWDERTKDIILVSVIVACLLLAIVLGIVTFKWRKEKLNAEKFNGTKIE